MEEVCRNGPADPRLLGHKFLDGRRQQQEKLRLEELQAEGLKARKQKEAKAETAKKTEPKQSAGQLGPGWARVLRDAKVRASKAKDADVVGNVWEGNRILTQEVASKAARIQKPVAGWVVLQKIAGPVLEQEPWQRQELGEPTATQQVTSMILQRLQLDATVETVPSNFGKECGSDSPSCTVRRANPDFRSLPDYAWQRLHLAFPRASWNESGNADPTEADEFVDAMSNYEGMEQEVFQDCEYAEEVAEIEAQPAAGNATDCGQFPCACPPSVFTCAAAADAETVVDAGQFGDFRSLPPESWQHIHAKFTRVAAESSTRQMLRSCPALLGTSEACLQMHGSTFMPNSRELLPRVRQMLRSCPALLGTSEACLQMHGSTFMPNSRDLLPRARQMLRSCPALLGTSEACLQMHGSTFMPNSRDLLPRARQMLRSCPALLGTSEACLQMHGSTFMPNSRELLPKVSQMLRSCPALLGTSEACLQMHGSTFMPNSRELLPRVRQMLRSCPALLGTSEACLQMHGSTLMPNSRELLPRARPDRC